LHAYDHHGVEGGDGGGEGLLGDIQVEGQLDDAQVLEEASRVHVHPAQIKGSSPRIIRGILVTQSITELLFGDSLFVRTMFCLRDVLFERCLCTFS
jgi:hypothetical protein